MRMNFWLVTLILATLMMFVFLNDYQDNVIRGQREELRKQVETGCGLKLPPVKTKTWEIVPNDEVSPAWQ